MANLLATVRCLGPPTLFVTLSADDNYWPELKMLLQNITYEEATRNSSANEQMRKDPLLRSLHPVGGGVKKVGKESLPKDITLNISYAKQFNY